MQDTRILEKTVIRGLLVILILVASSALIQFVAYPTPSWVPVAEKQQKFNSVQDQKFQLIFDKGSNAQQRGQYSEALSDYEEAERSVAQLNEDQYTRLADARAQIAALYDAAGTETEAEAVYKGLIESAFRDGALQLHSAQWQAALVRYQDAAKFSDHLSEQKTIFLIRSNQGEVETLRRMRHFPEAAASSQRLIEYLESSDEYDPAIVQAYMKLGETYQMQRDWEHVEQTLLASLPVCDRILDRNSGRSDFEDPRWKVIVSEDQILYALMDAYDQDRKPDQALAVAEKLYDFIAEHSTQWAELKPHSRNDVAKFAMSIAGRSNRPDLVGVWKQKIDPSRQF